MYFIRSNSIAGGQLPCYSWTRAPSFIRSVPGCARCLSGCRAYSSRQTDTAKAKAQATSGPEVAASPAAPDSSYCASRSHPRACPLSFSQVLAWPTVPSGFSVILSPLCVVVGPACIWDVPAPASQFCMQHFSPSVLRPLLPSLFAFPCRIPAPHRTE